MRERRSKELNGEKYTSTASKSMSKVLPRFRRRKSAGKSGAAPPQLTTNEETIIKNLSLEASYRYGETFGLYGGCRS